MAKSLKEMGWRQPVGAGKKPIKAIFNGDVGILNVNGKEYSVRDWTDEDFEDFCGEFGAPAIHPGKNGNECVATLTKDPTAELDKALKVIESKKRPATKRVVRENDELIDAAASPEAAPAPQPVPVPATQQAPAAASPVSQPGPMNPLVPPQPGMIPTGWMYPNQSAQSVAMETGDANLAAAAPGGGVVGGEPVTNEEAEMVQEYRKYKRAKRLESLASKIATRVKEASEDELEPEMPENPDLTMPPEAGEEGEGFEDETAVAGEEAEGDENVDIDMDELEDVVIDINKLFADAGGDLAAVTSPEALAGEEAEEENEDAFEGEPEDEDTEEPAEPVKESRKKKENKLVDMLPEDEADLGPELSGDIEGLDVEGAIPGDDDFFEDEIPDELDPGSSIQDYGLDTQNDVIAQRGSPTWRSGQNPEGIGLGESRKSGKRSWREAALPQNAVDIKFPAGTPAPKVSGEAVNAAYTTPAGSAIQAYEARAKARRAVLEEIRKRNRKAEALADADLSDAMKSQNEVIDEVIPGSNKDAMIDPLKEGKTARASGASAKFLENYREKQQLDYRQLLEQGLLG